MHAETTFHRAYAARAGLLAVLCGLLIVPSLTAVAGKDEEEKPVKKDLPPEAIGKVTFVKGKVTAERGKKEQALSLRSEVFQDDKLTCASDSKAKIEFNDGSIIWLGESSQITIDSYVYSEKEKKKSSSCLLRLVNGACRIVTGAITTINPERFKVRTRMATVGIRGCEVGIESSETRSDVYVMAVGAGEEIIVEATADGSRMMNPVTGERIVIEKEKQKTVSISDSDIRVSIIAGVGVERRALTEDEKKDFKAVTSYLPRARCEVHQKPNGSVLLVRPAAKEGSKSRDKE